MQQQQQQQQIATADAVMSIEVETAMTDLEIFNTLFAWFKREENYFHSPFVKQVVVKDEGEEIKLRIREEMPLFGSTKLPMVAHAVVTRDRKRLTIQSKTQMNGYDHVTVVVSFQRVGNGNLVRVTESLYFQLRWFLRFAPLLSTVMANTTRSAWTRSHSKVIQSLTNGLKSTTTATAKL